MALKGIDVFKLTPKTNCKECGNPTCMAFAMKVAQGTVDVEKCPHMSAEAKAQLSEATAPPMKSVKVGTGAAEHVLGGETVLFRHEKTLVSKNLFGINICPDSFDEKFAEAEKIDYERIGERMYVEVLNLEFTGDKDAYLELVKKAMGKDRVIVLDCKDVEIAKAAVEICKAENPVLNGATPENHAEMLEIAKAANCVLGLSAKDLDALYDLAAAVDPQYKNLILDVSVEGIKESFGNAVQVRRAALKDKDRTFGYPSLVNVGKLAPDNKKLQLALASVFVLKYGSIILMDEIKYSEALPLYGLRQNIYTDPQKPMKVEPGIYKINGADENSVCVTTVDFALTYFIISGELERSGVPCNLLISDAGGYSVLTAWAAGKFSAGTISKFIAEQNIEGVIKNRTLIIPGKVAVLKGELEENLPGWKIVVAPNESTGLVRFMKDFV